MGNKASLYGLGIYTYYGDNKDFLNNYASNGGKNQVGEILEIIIPNDCKTIDLEQLTKVQEYFFKLSKNFPKKDEKYNLYVENLLSNLGCFAAILGYDMIDVVDKQYFVILNRSKIIVNDKKLENINKITSR